MSGDRYAERSVDSGEFFNDDGIRDIVCTDAAVFFWEGDSGKAELCTLIPEVNGEFFQFVTFFRTWCHFLFCKIAHHFFNHQMVFIIIKIHSLFSLQLSVRLIA